MHRGFFRAFERATVISAPPMFVLLSVSVDAARHSLVSSIIGRSASRNIGQLFYHGVVME